MIIHKVKNIIQSSMQLSINNRVKILFVAEYNGTTFGYCSEKSCMAVFCREIFSKLKLDDVFDNSDYTELFLDEDDNIEYNQPYSLRQLRKQSDMQSKEQEVTTTEQILVNSSGIFNDKSINTQNEFSVSSSKTDGIQQGTITQKEKDDFLKSIESLDFVQYSIGNHGNVSEPRGVSLESLFPTFAREPLVKKKMNESKDLFNYFSEYKKKLEKSETDEGKNNKNLSDSSKRFIGHQSKKNVNKNRKGSTSEPIRVGYDNESDVNPPKLPDEKKESPSRKRLKLESIKKQRNLRIKIPERSNTLSTMEMKSAGDKPQMTFTSNDVGGGFITQNNFNNLININNIYDKAHVPFSSHYTLSNIPDEAHKQNDPYANDQNNRSKDELAWTVNDKRDYMRLVNQEDNLQQFLHKKQNRTLTNEYNEFLRPQYTCGTNGYMLNYSPNIFSPIPNHVLIPNNDCTPSNFVNNHYLLNSGNKIRTNSITNAINDLAHDMSVQRKERKDRFDFSEYNFQNK